MQPALRERSASACVVKHRVVTLTVDQGYDTTVRPTVPGHLVRTLGSQLHVDQGNGTPDSGTARWDVL